MSWDEALGQRHDAAPAVETPRATGQAVERARVYVAKMDPAISGQGGHIATFNAARKAADFGLSEGEILDVLREYNQRCQPPWSEGDLRHKAKEAHDKRTPRPMEDRELERKSRPGRAQDTDSFLDALAAEDKDDDLSTRVDKTPETETKDKRQPETIGSVFASWKLEGPLVHEPTGLTRLDELTGGGPVYGSRVYLAGAPDAGKTALLIQWGHVWAARGIHVGFLAVDEEPSDLLARLVQRQGWRRIDTELREPSELDRMEENLSNLPIRFYDSAWTIESAGRDLREAAGSERAALLVDSVQTVSCEAERLAEREMSEVAAVTARTRAIRSVASGHRLIAVATSEMGRSAYSSEEARRTVSTMAAGKWSGSIEYSARVLIGVRSVAGEKDLIDLEVAKNKHGPRDEHIYLKIDRPSQMLFQTDYAPEPEEDRAASRDQKIQQRVRDDAAKVAEIIRSQPGITTRKLWTSAQTTHGVSRNRAMVALDALGGAIVRGDGPNNSTPLTLDESNLPGWL